MYVMFSNAGKGDEPSREDFKYVAFATISICFFLEKTSLEFAIIEKLLSMLFYDLN